MRIRAIGAALLALFLATAAQAENFSVTKVRLRRNSSGQGDNSVLRMQGFFVTTPPTDVFNASNGVSVRIQDSVSTDVTITFDPVDCITVGAKTKCYGAGLKYRKLEVKVLKGLPDAFAVNLKVRQQNLAGPFDGPVTVTLTETGSGIDRVGTITDCVLKVNGLACRAF